MNHLRRHSMLLLVLSMALVATACNTKAEANDDEEEVNAEPAIPVEARAIARGRISNYFTGPISLETESDALIVAKSPGIVEKIFVEEGQRVKAGQILAQLEDDKETYQLAQAEAMLNQYDAEFARQRELFSKDLVSAAEFEQAKFVFMGQQAAWRLAKVNKKNMSLVAPFDGIVAERSIKIGNMVTGNTTAFRIVDYKLLKAVLYVPEIELTKLEVGQPATVRLDALIGAEFPAEVTLIAPIVDPTSGTVKVTVAVKNSNSMLKPGMFGRVQITHEVHENVLLLPKDAVLAEDRVTNVYVIADTLALRREVTLGLINTVSYEILDGLEEGDMVVTTGQTGLKDSTRIIVVAQ